MRQANVTLRRCVSKCIQVQDYAKKYQRGGLCHEMDSKTHVRSRYQNDVTAHVRTRDQCELHVCQKQQATQKNRSGSCGTTAQCQQSIKKWTHQLVPSRKVYGNMPGADHHLHVQRRFNPCGCSGGGLFRRPRTSLLCRNLCLSF